MKHLPAGRQHAYPRTFGQHPRGHPGRLLDHRFTTIQDQQDVGLAQELDHPRQRIAASRRSSGIQRARHHPGHVGGPPGAGKLDEPDPASKVGLHRPCRLQRQPALADPGRTDQGHQPVPPNQLDRLGQRLLATHQRGHRRRQTPPRPTGHGNAGQGRVMSQDRRLQPLQPRPRLDPQLLGQHPPSLPEGLQRLRLAAAAIQGQHQLPPQPLPERMLLQ